MGTRRKNEEKKESPEAGEWGAPAFMWQVGADMLATRGMVGGRGAGVNRVTEKEDGADAIGSK